MLKMGQMCHCKATLWKIDPATGEIVAHADRGLNSFGLTSYDDGTSIYLYESGAVSPAGFYATKWKDAGTGFEKQWEVAPSGLASANPIAYATDNRIWLADGGGQDIHRLADSDGSEVNSANVADPPHYMVPGDSGEMFCMSKGTAHYPSGTTLKRVDTNVTALVSLSGLWPGKCRLPNGWFVGVNASPRLIREYDDTLTLVASANAPLTTGTNRLYPSQRESTDGKVFCTELSSVGSTMIRWQRINVATLASDWSIAALSTGDTEAVGLTADGDVYVLAIGGAIYRLSGVDGSIVWSTAVGVTGSGIGAWGYYLIREGDLLLVVAAGASKQFTYSGSGIMAMALDYTDGSVVWARGAEGGGFLGGPHVVQGNLYVCGLRTQRSTSPDVYP